METERRILRSTSILFTARFVAQLANFGFVILFARVYGPAVFGEYTFALSLGAVLAIFVSMGTNGLLLRKASSDPMEWKPMAGLIFPGQMFLAATTWLVVILIGALLGVHGVYLSIIAIVTLFQLLNPITTLFASGFTATERMAYAAIADAGGRIFILIVAGVAMVLGASIEFALLVFPVSAILVLVILARLSSAEFGRPVPRIDLRAYFALLREALPFFVNVGLTVVYTRIGILILRSTSTADEVGVFASAERLVMAASILYATFAQAVYPAMVRLFAHDKAAFSQLVHRSTRLILLVCLPMATLLFLFAEDIIVGLFGAPFRDASRILQIVAWLIAFRGITTILINIAIAIDRQNMVVRSNVAGLTVLVASCLVLTPSHGALGLAVALIVAQSVKSTGIYLFLRSSGHLPGLGRIALPVAAACAVTGALAIALSDASLFVRASTVVVAGLALLYLFRAVRTEDFQYAYQLLSTRSAARGN
jgi:O-antigen/teichoic acid export membrane protein